MFDSEFLISTLVVFSIASLCTFLITEILDEQKS